MFVLEFIMYIIARIMNNVIKYRWYLNNELYHRIYDKANIRKIMKNQCDKDFSYIKSNVSQTLSVFDGKKLYTTYEDYDSKIKQICNGIYDIIFPGKPNYFVTTTGTTSKSKLIPVFLTKPTITYPMSYLLPLMRKEIMNHMFFGRVAYFIRRGDIKDINGIECSNGVTRQISNALNSKIMTYLITRSSTSPFPVYSNDNKLYPVMDLHIIHALMDSNISAIGGYFTRSILEQFDRIINNMQVFCDAIALGEYDTGFDIYSFPASSDRANEIRNIFNCSNKNLWGIINKIWPKLKIIICGKSAAFNIYEPRINFYTNNIPIYSSLYASTEMTFGINLGNINSDSYYFDNRLGVIHQDKELWYEDKYLRLVVTSKNGLTKYLINDLISINDNGTFTCEGRYTFYEKTGITEREFAQAIIKDLGIFTHDALLVDTDNSFELYCEGYSINKHDNLYFKKIITNIVDNLHQRVKKPVLKFCYVNKGTFKKLLDHIELSHKDDFVSIAREQIKLPRLIDKDSELTKIIYNNIK